MDLPSTLFADLEHLKNAFWSLQTIKLWLLPSCRPARWIFVHYCCRRSMPWLYQSSVSWGGWKNVRLSGVQILESQLYQLLRGRCRLILRRLRDEVAAQRAPELVDAAVANGYEPIDLEIGGEKVLGFRTQVPLHSDFWILSTRNLNFLDSWLTLQCNASINHSVMLRSKETPRRLCS